MVCDSNLYDAIVLGVGGVGSAALLHLAEAGLRVLGLDQFSIAHDRGSSHGETRIIRKAYFEHSDYVPLLLRSYDLWHDLEASTGSSLYEECGLFLAGPADGDSVAGARHAARLHGLPLEDVTNDEARRRCPQFLFNDDHEVVFEREAGYLRVESAVRAHATRACSLGAEFREELVGSWTSDGSVVRVRTENGSYEAGALVVTAGAWASRLLDQLGLPLIVLRKPQFWFRTRSPAWAESPAFFFEQDEGCFYGFPAMPQDSSRKRFALKAAEHTGGDVVADPTTVDRRLGLHDSASTSAFLLRTLRHVDAQPLRHSVCMYTMTPDGHFVIDRHPEWPNVVFAAGLSGHGFKFTPVIGVALSDLTLAGRTSLPIDFLRLDRPGLRARGDAAK